jgi:hypothetical protein
MESPMWGIPVVLGILQARAKQSVVEPKTTNN